MALPTALLATVIAFSLAITAVVASVDSQRGTARDHDSKEAIAAADAGANVAMFRLNHYGNALNSSTPCLRISGGILTTGGAEADGWCPTITGSVGGATYSYRVMPQSTTSLTSVVSTGTSGNVSRRIDATLKASSAGGVLQHEGVIGQDGITFGGNADIRVGIGTNGKLTTSGNTELCGNIRYGVGQEWSNLGNNAHQCSGYSVTEGNSTLPSVSTFIPSEIATNNSDYRLVTCTKTAPVREPAGCQSDTYNGNWKTSPPWNPVTRAITLSGKNSGEEPALTLGGSDYWLCKLTITAGHLIMANEAHVRLFFDTPEHCGMKAGEAQIVIEGNGNIEATGFAPELGRFDLPGFYLLGSTTVPTVVKLAGNGSTTDQFVLYAPNTAIEITGNANYVGVIAGKSVYDSGNGALTQPTGFEGPQIGGATVYSRQSYVECTGATASPPNANC